MKAGSAVLKSVSRPLQRAWSAYCHQLLVRPLVSRIATGAAGAAVSDWVAQSVEAASARRKATKHPQPTSHECSRTLRLVAYSAIVGTPITIRWFGFLDQNVFPAAQRSARAVFTKVALDQAIMAPLSIGLFIAGMKSLEGQAELAGQALSQTYVGALQANYLVWPPLHALNFFLIPPSQRILFMNVVNVAWGALMSHLVLGGHHDVKGTAKAPGTAAAAAVGHATPER